MEALFNVAQGFGLMLIVMGMALLLGMSLVVAVLALAGLGEQIASLIERGRK